jgi:serine/threonine protein kinase
VSTTLLEAERAESSDQKEPFEIKDHYQLTGEILGEGAFGTVYKATRKADGMPVAIKEIERSDDADQSEFEREIAALSELSKDGGHPNICRLYACHRTADVNYVVMEIIDGGEILEHLIQGGPYSEITASKFFRELAEGINSIHSHNIIHADLKCENLMLSSWDDSNAVLKVVDFGTSVPADDIACKGLGGDIADFKGTAAYCSPERLRDDTGCPSKADDMWAVGAILFILLTGSHPFDPQGTMCDEDIEEVVLSISPDEAGMTRFHDVVLDQKDDIRRPSWQSLGSRLNC